MLERWQSAQEGDENLLDEIGGVVLRFAAAPRPEEQERRVEMDQPLPGRIILRLT
jgi:hypothetical protein